MESLLPLFPAKHIEGQRLSLGSVVKYKKSWSDDDQIQFVDGHFDSSIRLGKKDVLPTEDIKENDSENISVHQKLKNIETFADSENNEVQNICPLSDNNGNIKISDIPLEQTNTSEDDHRQRFDSTSETGIKPKAMKKSHYVDKSQRRKCTGCHKTFKLKRNPKHCRRCGEVFCLPCVKYRRKLNVLANPDPEGKLRKVCGSCFEEDALLVGHTRSLTDEFINERSFAKYGRLIHSRVNSLTTTFWPDQIDIQSECVRLLTGFQGEVRQLGSVNSLQALKVKLKTPAWQKSKYWNIEIQSQICRACKGDVGIRKSTGNCRVCGLALCRKCSYKELLLYFDTVEITEEAKLALINIPGAPLQEPNISLLLYVCLSCKQRITQKQQQHIYWFKITTERTICDDIIVVDTKFKTIKENIALSIQKLEEIIDNTECAELSSFRKRNASTQLTTLRSALTTHEKELKHVRSWFDETLTRSHILLLSNFIKSNQYFYLDSRYKCRALSNKLDAK